MPQKSNILNVFFFLRLLRKSNIIHTNTIWAFAKILASDSIGFALFCFVQGRAICRYILLQSKTSQMKSNKKKCSHTHREYTLFRNQTPHAIQTTWKIYIYYLSLILQILFTQLFKQKQKCSMHSSIGHSNWLLLKSSFIMCTSKYWCDCKNSWFWFNISNAHTVWASYVYVL